MKERATPLEGNIFMGLFRFAIPVVLVQALSMAFSVMDSMVIANFGSSMSMGAIGETTSMISLILCLISGLPTGVSVAVALAFGKRDENGIRSVLQSLVPTALAVGLAVSCVAIPLARPLMALIACPTQLMDGACLYFRIYFLSIPFMAVFMFLSSALQAKGDTVRPLYFETAAGVLNLLLNLLFVIVFRWDIAGVAVATVLSQAFAAGAALYYMCAREKELRIDIRRMTLFRGLSSVMRIGVTSSVSSVVMDIASVLIIRGINTFGELAAVGSSASSAIEGLMALAFVGFGSACGVFISQNYGARNFQRIREIMKRSLLLCFGLGQAAGMLIYLLGPTALGLFISESADFTREMAAEAMAAGLVRLKWLGLFYGFCGTMNVFGGSIRSLNEPKAALWISVICSGVLRVAWILITVRTIHTLDALFAAFPMCWILMTIVSAIVFERLLRRKQAEEAAQGA